MQAITGKSAYGREVLGKKLQSVTQEQQDLFNGLCTVVTHYSASW